MAERRGRMAFVRGDEIIGDVGIGGIALLREATRPLYSRPRLCRVAVVVVVVDVDGLFLVEWRY